MVTITATFLIFLVIAIIMGVGFYSWIKTEKSSRPHRIPRMASRTSQKCPICGNVFSALPHDGFTKCPVCDSTNPAQNEAREEPDRDEE